MTPNTRPMANCPVSPSSRMRERRLFPAFPMPEVGSLRARGFNGTFHFLDLMPGLEATWEGIPGWLAWFAIIAIHSDLLIFVGDEEGGLRGAQQSEADYTADSVQKVIVRIPRDELTWAKENTDDPDAPIMYVGPNGMMTQAEWYAMEAEHAMPFVRRYLGPGIPRDRLIQVSEAGSMKQFPLNYPRYQFLD